MNDREAVSRRRLTGDMAFQLGGRAANLVLGVLVTLTLVRTLGDEDFGKFATALAVVQIAGYFGELGLEQVTTTRASAERERQREWIGALVSLRLLLSVPTMLAAMGVIVVLADGESMRTAGLLLAGILALGAPGAMKIVFRLRVRNRTPTLVQMLNSFLWAGAAVAIAAGGGGLVAFSGALLAVTALTTSLQAGLARRLLAAPLERGRRVRRELLVAGTWTGVAAILTTAYVKIDQVFVFELASTRDAGLYGAVYRVLDQVQFVPVIAMTTLLPLMSAAFKVDQHRGRRIFERSLDWLVLASLPALAFSIAAAEPTVALLFGDQFRDAAPALPILMGAFVLTAVSYVSDGIVVILRLQRRLAAHAAVALVVNVALNLALVPRYGFLAAAWATVITQAVVVALNGGLVFRRIRAAPLGTRTPRTAIAAAGMGVAVWALERAGTHIVGLALAAAVTYTALALAVRAVRVAEVRSLLHREGEWSL